VRCLGVSLPPSPDGDTDRVEFEVVTCSDRPDLDEAAAAAFRERWPEFVFHDVLTKQYMKRVDDYFGQCQPPHDRGRRRVTDPTLDDQTMNVSD
jgi:hypothetical protein